MHSIETMTHLSEEDKVRELFFWRIYRSKYCKETSINNLKWDYTLPEILSLYSNIEMQEAIDEAIHLDNEPKAK